MNLLWKYGDKYGGLISKFQLCLVHFLVFEGPRKFGISLVLKHIICQSWLLNIFMLFIINFDKLFVTLNPFDEHNGSNGFQLQRFIRVGPPPPGSGDRPTFCTKVMNLSQIYIWISKTCLNFDFNIFQEKTLGNPVNTPSKFNKTLLNGHGGVCRF